MAGVDGFRLCRYPNCEKCAKSPEFVPIHFDCYSIFIKECLVQDTDALRRLWVRSAWRTPWRGAQPLYLSRQQLASGTLKRTAEICGLPEMCRMPRELVEIIRGYSRHSLFWRCISAIQSASYVTRATLEPLLTVQLSQVLSWKRGGELKCITSPTPPPIIRLMIDFDGISRVERLFHTPTYSGECSNSYRSVIQHASLIEGIEAQVKVRIHGILLDEKHVLMPSSLRMVCCVSNCHMHDQHSQYGTRPHHLICPLVKLMAQVFHPGNTFMLLKRTE